MTKMNDRLEMPGTVSRRSFLLGLSATAAVVAGSSLGSYFHPELHFRENRSSPAKSLLEFSAWREVRQKVRQISTVFKTGHLQEKNRRAPTNADALR